jgi:hypothetical protein
MPSFYLMHIHIQNLPSACDCRFQLNSTSPLDRSSTTLRARVKPLRKHVFGCIDRYVWNHRPTTRQLHIGHTGQVEIGVAVQELRKYVGAADNTHGAIWFAKASQGGGKKGAGEGAL